MYLQGKQVASNSLAG